MKQQRNFQIFIIAILSVTVLIMSIGFAYYQNNFEVDGTVNVTNSSWSVHFADSITPSSGSEAIESNVADDGTSLEWSTTLSEPGDYAEFSINVLNEGTFNALLTDITMGGIAGHADYLKYEVYYNNSDTPYEATTSGLNISLDKKGENATVVPVRVKVTYVAPSDSTKLPTSDVEANLTLALTYKQEGYNQQA